MTRIRLILHSALLLSFLCPSLWAVSSRVGTSGAQFLRIGAGARPTAMGEAFVGIADDVNAVYYNPAGLATLEFVEVTAMQSQWFQDIDYHFAAVAVPSEYGTFGFQAQTLEVKNQEKRGLNESFQGTFKTLDAAYALSYGRKIFPSFSAGATFRFIDQKIDSASAGTYSGDVGVLLKIPESPYSFGLAIRHFGQEVKFNDEGDPQPFVIDFGVGADLFKERLKMGINVFQPRDNYLQYGIGGEWKQKITDDFRAAARLGYKSHGTDADESTGISLGGGIGFRKLDLDFAWVPFGDLGNTFRYAALIRF